VNGPCERGCGLPAPIAEITSHEKRWVARRLSIRAQNVGSSIAESANCLPFARDAVNIWFLHRGCIFSEPYSPPHLFPCLRFALHLAVPDKTRGRADRYSLLVGILHSLLHAGLSRRTAIFHQLRRYGPEVPFAVRYGLIPSNLRSAISGPAGGTICWHGLSTEGAWG
jgi:hypothetical protein